ncbi:NF-kappa-B inhibitor cactus-like [Metopolophium dirhodum]|uniref:NF-kappa-B inhibitor cactus-like n=1 Tax=Metopolophium dirhodum TaxID=44670 RepID=UPI002990737F|nr:NF-kappa-B inhibitor cactus-like [Metopolophium dirhodum]
MRLPDHGFALIAADARVFVDEVSTDKMLSTMVVRKLFLGQRDKQLQSIKSEKVAEDNGDINMDSGFLSGGNLSGDNMLSKEEHIEDDIKHEELNDIQQKETPKTTIDSDMDNPSKVYIDKKVWQFYFQQNDDGDTLLHLAIIHGYIQVSKRLIDICPDSKMLDIRNDDGQSALHLAVMTNQCEIVKHLMKANANAEILDYKGNTAVHLACYDGKLDCLKIFANYVLLPKIFDTINYDGLACIHIATIANHPKLIRFIVNTSKNVNIRDHKSGYTALHFAVALNRANLIECLIDKVDPNIESYAGKLAFEVEDEEDDYDEDKEDDEISDDLMKSVNALQLPNNNSIKC